MSNDAASVPSRLYSSVSPLSASVAVTAAPTSVPAALFSSTARGTLASANTGALLGARRRSVTVEVDDQSRLVPVHW